MYVVYGKTGAARQWAGKKEGIIAPKKSSSTENDEPSGKVHDSQPFSSN